MANSLNLSTERINQMSFEVDGERQHFDSFYDDCDFPHVGAFYGVDETTKAGDAVRNFSLTNCVFGLAAYRSNEDGSVFGIQGLYRNGTWDTDEEGNPLYRVWDRIV